MGVETVSTAARYDVKTVKEGAEEMENDEQSFLDDTSCWCCFWGARRPPKISHSNSLHDGSFDESEKTNKSERSSLSHWSLKGEEELLSSSQLRKFCFNDLKSATRNFRPDSLLGEGGFGCVFKGWIDEHGTAPVKPGTGLTVAVKILKQSGLQGHREWLAELNFLGQLSHPNLAKLIGYCIEDDQRLLVYEFLQRGSLENHLFRKGALPLRWSTRMKIALGAAKGLAFLHSGDRPIIYRDFKTSNILLDSEYSPKLSDFGLARDGPAGDRTHVSTRVLGTCGYAAPEYVMTGHLTVKSDVYSYGVVLLEILTGKRAVDKRRPSGEHNLVEWTRPHLQDKKKLYKVLDPGLDSQSQCSPKALKTLAILAYRCTSRDSKSRPLMPEVVQIMESVSNMRVTPPSTTTASTRTPTNSSPTPLFRQSIQRGPVTSTADKQCRQIGMRAQIFLACGFIVIILHIFSAPNKVIPLYVSMWEGVEMFGADVIRIKRTTDRMVYIYIYIYIYIVTYCPSFENPQLFEGCFIFRSVLYLHPSGIDNIYIYIYMGKIYRSTAVLIHILQIYFVYIKTAFDIKISVYCNLPIS